MHERGICNESGGRCNCSAIDGSHVPSSHMVVENESATVVTHLRSGSFDREDERTRVDGELPALRPASYSPAKPPCDGWGCSNWGDDQVCGCEAIVVVIGLGPLCWLLKWVAGVKCGANGIVATRIALGVVNIGGCFDARCTFDVCSSQPRLNSAHSIGSHWSSAIDAVATATGVSMVWLMIRTSTVFTISLPCSRSAAKCLVEMIG